MSSYNEKQLGTRNMMGQWLAISAIIVIVIGIALYYFILTTKKNEIQKYKTSVYVPSVTSIEKLSLPNTKKNATASVLKKPDSDSPASGICEKASSSFAIITLREDMPAPRCVKVRATQYLHVINDTSQKVTVELGKIHLIIAPGDKQTSALSFGKYLAKGVHKVTTSLYGRSGPEVWLQ